MQTERKQKFIIDFVYMSLILVIGYLIAKYFLGILFPFVLGFLIAFALRPVIKFINKKIKVNNKIISLVVLLLFYSLIGGGLFFVSIKIFTMLKSLFEDIPMMYQNDIQPLINQFTLWSKDLFYRINPEIIDFIQQFDKNIIEQLSGIVKNFSSGAVSLLTAMVTKLPSFLLAFLFTIISSFFITLDYDKITEFLDYQITDKNRRIMSAIKRNGIDVVVNFFKAYGILLSVTFIEAAIGLSLMGIKNAIGISIVIAMVDIFPVLGTGTVLVPWAIIEFFNGNVPDAIGLVILYAVITVIRQILEPRVVGDSIGLYPLVTLVSMFLGVKYFGGIGLLGLPIVVTIIVKLHEEGIIKIWRDPKQKKIVKKEKNV